MNVAPKSHLALRVAQRRGNFPSFIANTRPADRFCPSLVLFMRYTGLPNPGICQDFFRISQTDVRFLNILNARLVSGSGVLNARAFRRGPEYPEWARIQDIHDVGAVS